MKIKDKSLIGAGVVFGLASILLFASPASAQTGQDPAPAVSENVVRTPDQTKPAEEAPAIDSVRDVELGMTVAEVKSKLGKPDVSDDTGMYFTLSGGDSVQIGLDKDKKVRSIASIYAAGSSSAPTIDDVLGKAAEHADGDVHQMVRYPAKGYWVSYSRSNSKSKPVVVVMMRKIF